MLPASSPSIDGASRWSGTQRKTWDVSSSPAARASPAIWHLRGRVTQGKGKVSLYLAASGAGITAARLQRPMATAAVAANGFFQLSDIPPGRYALQAEYPGFATATVAGIDVYPHVESKLKRPIELSPPMTLTVRLEPANDAEGHDWTIVVMRASPVSNRYDAEPIYNARARGGSVELKNEPGGRYSVIVADARGNTYASEEFTTSAVSDELHTVSFHLVRVSGMVRRGDKPLSATLWFGGRFGERHVVTRADDEGKFICTLPRTRSWRIHIETAGGETELTTRVSEASGNKPATVDVRLPATRVSGVVTDAGDQLLSNAVVTLTPVSPLNAQSQQTDRNGTFSFDGVEAGAVTLRAEQRSSGTVRTSPPWTATLASDEAVDGVTLKVEDGRRVHGRVLGADGPVVGADVAVYTGSDLEIASMTNATTGPDGVFDAGVPAGVGHAFMEVQAPGFALRVFEVAVDGRAVTLNLPRGGGNLAVTVPADAQGLFFFQDGRLLPLGALAAWAQSRGEPLVTERTLRVSDVAPGRYRACTMTAAPPITRRCAEGFLAPYGDLRLTID